MVENPSLIRMSAFADCGSQSIILRIPFELAADMLKHCPPSKDKDELQSKMLIAARKSKKLTALLKGLNDFGG